MLINTVILFLRDALPVFVAMAILLSLLQKQGIKHSWSYVAAIIGLLFSFALLSTFDSISHALDDTGREWLYGSLYLVCYCTTLLLLSQVSMASKVTSSAATLAIIRYCALVLIIIVMMLNGANFLIYITGFWHQNNASNVLSIGVVLGIGICTSIAVLLYFLMDAVQRYYRLISETLLVFFSAGLLMQATNLLLQIDVLTNSKALWDSNHLVIENSEIGYLLTVFFGYDATPTLMQLSLYIAAIVIAFILIFIRSGYQLKKNNRRIQEAVS